MHFHRALVLLFTCLVAAVAIGCGGSDSDSDSGDSGGSGGGTSAKALDYEFFKTADGNISCVVNESDGARCDIRNKTWTPPPKPKDCMVDWGFGLSVAAGKGQFLCAGDTVAMPDAPVLKDGQATASGNFECTTANAGVTCTNTDTGNGFSISKETAGRF